MKVKNLYRFIRSDEGITVSPICPENVEYLVRYRVIADEGKLLTLDGETTYGCADVDDVTGWYEIEDASHADEYTEQEISGDEFLSMMEEVL